MATVIHADASPEKRLFISLLTRDISLIAAVLDLIDNSINAAVEPYANKLKTADEYLTLSGDASVSPNVNISLTVSDENVEIRDTACGISAKTAGEHVFKFGRGASSVDGADRLSVYGIGLKRAIFKLGNRISMRSEHVDGGFDLKLDVSKWAKTSVQPWTFDITPRKPVPKGETFTSIVVSDLYDDVKRRISDGVFCGQLRESIARTYAYYLAKLVNIDVNADKIEGVNIDLGVNHASERFEFDGVTCAITAGIGVPQAGGFRDKSSGWFVFCNGRTVISADKTPLTGWGAGSLPIFQPKHRPFLGTVFFVSENPELLPWTTTKAGINEDSAIWQTAKRHMATIGREVVTFLDGRYTDEGTEVGSKELQLASGSSRVSVLSAAIATPQRFRAPVASENTTVRIQYDAKTLDIKRIAKYLKRSSMSASDVGRHTFNHFLRNEVGEE